jgi:hypothetical protein
MFARVNTLAYYGKAKIMHPEVLKHWTQGNSSYDVTGLNLLVSS